jgi:tetratricopeptide (TPR) repeat protein
MNFSCKKCIAAILFSCGISIASAQYVTLPTEARQVYESANTALSNGDFSNAIMLYAQAIRIAPDNVMLRRDLAYTYFLSGNKQKAQEIIEPVVNSDVADEQTFQVASAIESALGNNNKAAKYINAGLKKFPQSGILYNAKGNLALSDKKGGKTAIDAWQEGISADPGYHGNYYNAAKYYLANGNPVWAALFAQIDRNEETDN